MILTINCGSSTIKFQLYSADLSRVIARGAVNQIGEPGSHLSYRTNGRTLHDARPFPSHHEAFEACIAALLDPKHGAIKSIHEIEAVGHRAVHGADLFVESTLIDDGVIAKMEECVPLAPLHNPPNLIGIREARKLLPGVPQVAVFDTAFNQTLPPKAFLYALPYRFYQEHKIRKYGFHGTSVRYVSQRAAEVLGSPLEALKTVVCHLGNGVTMTAVDGGRAVDTTIGFATFGGVMMGTRSGDIDPGLIFHLHRALGLTLDEIERIIYRESGLLGLSGVSNDMRTIAEQANSGNERCHLAMEKFAYMVRGYIGSFAAAMGGINCLVFTAGIGENSPLIRAMACQGLEFLGIRVDEARNKTAVGGKEALPISPIGGATPVLVVPTDEEKMIAMDTLRLAHPSPPIHPYEP
ncbi:MAG: acetate kinase [Anaerolineales bacterium]|nr:acetate kinase [Anaerolineales bacterium]